MARGSPCRRSLGARGDGRPISISSDRPALTVDSAVLRECSARGAIELRGDHAAEWRWPTPHGGRNELRYYPGHTRGNEQLGEIAVEELRTPPNSAFGGFEVSGQICRPTAPRKFAVCGQRPFQRHAVTWLSPGAEKGSGAEEEHISKLPTKSQRLPDGVPAEQVVPLNRRWPGRLPHHAPAAAAGCTERAAGAAVQCWVLRDESRRSSATFATRRRGVGGATRRGHQPLRRTIRLYADPAFMKIVSVSGPGRSRAVCLRDARSTCNEGSPRPGRQLRPCQMNGGQRVERGDGTERSAPAPRRRCMRVRPGCHVIVTALLRSDLSSPHPPC